MLSKIDRIDGNEAGFSEEILATLKEQKVNLKKHINEEAIMQERNYKTINH